MPAAAGRTPCAPVLNFDAKSARFDVRGTETPVVLQFFYGRAAYAGAVEVLRSDTAGALARCPAAISRGGRHTVCGFRDLWRARGLAAMEVPAGALAYGICFDLCGDDGGVRDRGVSQRAANQVKLQNG